MIPLILFLACNEADKSSPQTEDSDPVQIVDDSGPPDSEACDSGLVGYADADGDGHGDASVPVTGCDDAAYVAEGDDCDDGDASVHPDATETCDTRDEDCDGETDEGLGTSWYTDADGDGHGDPATAQTACDAPAGTVPTEDDCDDTEPLAWEGATEVCGDGVDNDCDGAGCGLTGVLDIGDGYAVHTGTSSGDYAGLGVAPAGDWNGDGAADLFIGASLEDANGRESGAVYIVTATDSGPLSGALASADGPHEDASLGQSAAAVDDLTGDGRVDLVAGCPSYISDGEFKPGAAMLYDGATGTSLDEHTMYVGVGNYEGLGYASVGVGDLDGDGGADLLLGAPTHGYLESTQTGAVYLVFAAPGGTVDVTDAAWQVLGDTREAIGAALATLGDVDGDGVDDVLVGSLGTGDAAAWLVTDGWSDAVIGDIAAASFAPESTTAATGTAVAGPGDVDGDGHADLLIGAYADATSGMYAGAAWLITGAPSGALALSSADAKIIGEKASAFAGMSLGGVADIDGDGGAEIVVGARQDTEGGSNAGAVFLLAGSTRGTVSTSTYLTKIRGSTSNLVGARLGDAGDLDGDGASDLWISGTGYDGNKGAVWLYSLWSL